MSGPDTTRIPLDPTALAKTLGVEHRATANHHILEDPLYGTVVEFEGSAAAGYTNFRTTLNNNAFTTALLPLTQNEVKLFHNLRGALNLPALTKEQNQFIEDYQQDRALLESLGSIPLPRYGNHSYSMEHANDVRQREIGITHGDSEKYIEFTVGPSPCLALSMYNAATHVGALAHVDEKTDIASLDEHLRMLRGSHDKGTIEVNILGGFARESEALLVKLARYLQAQPNVEIVGIDVMREDSPKVVALDCRDGSLLKDRFPEHYAQLMETSVASSLPELTTLRLAHHIEAPRRGGF